MPSLTVTIFIVAAAIFSRNDYFRTPRTTTESAEPRSSSPSWLAGRGRWPEALRSAKWLLTATVVGSSSLLSSTPATSSGRSQSCSAST